MIPSVQEPVPSPDADAVSDGELVERFRKGEIAAFDTLFQRYNQPLCKYAVRLTDREHGYDLASEIFTIAFRQLPFLEEADRFKAWLYRIATHRIHDYWRHEKLISWIPWKKVSEDNRTSMISVAGPEQKAEQDDFIIKIMQHVSQKYRPCIYLDIFEDMRQHQIATLLNISERSVRRYIALGKAELREVYPLLVKKYGALEWKVYQ